jgi:uncharacterized small protein (DUF1192 family)
MADHERLGLHAPALRAVGGDAAEEQALEDGRPRRRVLAGLSVADLEKRIALFEAFVNGAAAAGATEIRWS